MPLHNQVKRYREEKGISQTELGKLCGVSRQTISSIERGDYHPSVVLALRIVSIFGKKVEDIFCWEEESDEGA
jgi:putative transcriptional regulator